MTRQSNNKANIDDKSPHKKSDLKEKHSMLRSWNACQLILQTAHQKNLVRLYSIEDARNREQ